MIPGPNTKVKEYLHGVQWSSLVKQNILDTGTFGTVLSYSHKTKQKYFVIKFIKYSKCNNFDKELEFLKKIDDIEDYNLYFPKFYGYIKYKNEFNELFYGLVFEKADGNLLNYLKELKSKSDDMGLSYIETYNLISNLSFGLAILQKRKSAHRDIKPENILYYKHEDKIIFKITDFGEIKLKYQKHTKGTVRGTPAYYSPELTFANSKGEYVEKEYNPFKSDVYSLGLNLIKVILKKMPYEDASREREKEYDPLILKNGPYDQAIKGLIEEIKVKYSSDIGLKLFIGILKNCLEYNPKYRNDMIELNEQFKLLPNPNRINLSTKISGDFDDDYVKKTCQKCQKKIAKKNMHKMLCCSKYFCFKCLNKKFKPKIFGQKYLHCINNDCKSIVSSNDSIFGKMLESDTLEIFEKTYNRKEKCDVCKKYLKINKILKPACQHMVCEHCFFNYLNIILRGSVIKNKIQCPENECNYFIGFNEIESMKFKKRDFLSIIEKYRSDNIEVLNSDIEEEEKELFSINSDSMENMEKIEEKPKFDGFDMGKREEIEEEFESSCIHCYKKSPNRNFIHLKCNHKFCKNCIIFYLEEQITEKGEIKCFFENCKSDISYLVTTELLNEKFVEIYNNRNKTRETACIPRIRSMCNLI